MTTSMTSLYDLPQRRAGVDPAGEAVADPTVTLSNADFAASVAAAADALAEAGVRARDVVALLLPNQVFFLIALFAAWRIGATVCPLNPALTNPEIDYQLEDSGAVVLVTTTDLAGRLDTVVQVLTGLAPSEDRAAESVECAEPLAIAPDELALIIYTSGSTGRPKGVMLEHRHLLAMADMIVNRLEYDAATVCLLILPLFHVNGIVVSALTTLLVGGCVVIAPRFDPDTFFDTLAQVRPTFFSGVPTIYVRLLEVAATREIDTSSLRFMVCGAAPASAELTREVEARFGVPLVEGYGLSETSSAASVNPLQGTRKPGTVGLPFEGQGIRIVDPLGQDVAVGENGEVLVAGPNVMRGYLGKPQETARTLVDGWLHTGDVGRLDEDGYLTMVDRLKDMIIRGGENIYPKEIELAAYEFPGVGGAAAVGRPDAEFGEVPVLFIIPLAGASLDPAQLLDWLRTRLARFKLPVDIEVLDAIPMNAMGKFDKLALRALLREGRPSWEVTRQ
jgi:O-succinylbenzoate-CoA ligase